MAQRKGGKNRPERRRRERQAVRERRSTTAGASIRRQIFERVKDAVVAVGLVHSPRPSSNDVPFTVGGTGVCIDPRGAVLTAAHVVDDVARMLSPGEVPAIFFATHSATDTQAETLLTAIPAASALAPESILASKGPDIALLRLATQRVDLPFVEIGNTFDLWEGEELAFCGYPFGGDLHGGATLTSSFHRALVSAILPNCKAPVGPETRIQLDASINPGNSGGPLFRPSDGRVVGIVIQRVSFTSQVASIQLDEDRKPRPAAIDVPTGLGVAVPVAWAAEVLPRVRLEMAKPLQALPSSPAAKPLLPPPSKPAA